MLGLPFLDTSRSLELRIYSVRSLLLTSRFLWITLFATKLTQKRTQANHIVTVSAQLDKALEGMFLGYLCSIVGEISVNIFSLSLDIHGR